MVKGESLRTETRELLIERRIDAPRSFVWKAWTDAARMQKWFGPNGYTIPSITLDARVGGGYFLNMRSSDGIDNWSKGKFVEMEEPSRLVFMDSFADEHGNTVPASHYGMSSHWPEEARATLTLEEIDPMRTSMTIVYEDIPVDEFEAPRQGWEETLDRLAEYLANLQGTMVTAEPGKMDFFIEHFIRAPRELVFKAFVDPDLYVRWLGPKGYKTMLEKFEPHSGGSWRFLNEDEQGNKYAFHGVFHEVLEPSRLIDTFEYEGLPESGHVSLEVLTLDDLGGKFTRLLEHSVFTSVEDRDGMIGSGMEEGVREGYQKLDGLLEEMQAQQGEPT